MFADIPESKKSNENPTTIALKSNALRSSSKSVSQQRKQNKPGPWAWALSPSCQAPGLGFSARGLSPRLGPKPEA